MVFLQLPATYTRSHDHTAVAAPPMAVELLISIYIYTFGHTVSRPNQKYDLPRCNAEPETNPDVFFLRQVSS